LVSPVDQLQQVNAQGYTKAAFTLRSNQCRFARDSAAKNIPIIAALVLAQRTQCALPHSGSKKWLQENDNGSLKARKILVCKTEQRNLRKAEIANIPSERAANIWGIGGCGKWNYAAIGGGKRFKRFFSCTNKYSAREISVVRNGLSLPVNGFFLFSLNLNTVEVHICRRFDQRKIQSHKSEIEYYNAAP
jgi:hypothetical protein